LAGHLSHNPDLFPSPSVADRVAAMALNGPVTACEVDRALTRTARGKAAGLDGLPAEFLSEAWLKVGRERRYVLSEHLASLFTKVMREGYPPSWGTCTLTPVPKGKGDPSLHDNYRSATIVSFF